MCRVSLKASLKIIALEETHCFCSVSLETPPWFYNLLKTKSDSRFLRTVIGSFFGRPFGLTTLRQTRFGPVASARFKFGCKQLKVLLLAEKPWNEKFLKYKDYNPLDFSGESMAHYTGSAIACPTAGNVNYFPQAAWKLASDFYFRRWDSQCSL